MTFPDGLATTIVTAGPYLDGGGQPAAGRVRLVPEGRVLHSPSGAVILPDAATITLDGGAGQTTVVASDADGVTPNPFAYWVYWDLPGRSSPEPRRVFLPAGTVDLDALQPSTSGTGPIAVPAVSSVAGLSGAVTAAQVAAAVATQPALAAAADGAAAGTATVLGNSLRKVGIVLDTGAPGAFDSEAVESLFPFLDPESGRIAGVYTGYGLDGDGQLVASVGLARSDDGVSWEKAGKLIGGSGVTGAPDEAGCTAPVIVLRDGLYHLFRAGLTTPGYEGGVKRMILSTTPSLAAPQWTHHGVMLAPTGGDTAVWHPTFVRDDGEHCFVNCTRADSTERIFHATAPALTGPWSWDDPHTPALPDDTTGGITGDPFVRKVPGGWRMDYFATDAAFANSSDWYSTTVDAAFPHGWTPHDPADFTRRTLAPGAAGEVDATAAAKPTLLTYAGRLHHFYVAVGDNGHRAVGLAVDPPLPTASAVFAIPETTPTRSTQSQAGEPMGQSGFLFDRTGRTGLEVRLLIRANPGPAATMTVWVNDVPDCRVTLSGDDWHNGVGEWAPVPAGGLLSSFAMWSSSNGWTVQFGSGAYEFRWRDA